MNPRKLYPQIIKLFFFGKNYRPMIDRDAIGGLEACLMGALAWGWCKRLILLEKISFQREQNNNYLCPSVVIFEVVGHDDWDYSLMVIYNTSPKAMFEN